MRGRSCPVPPRHRPLADDIPKYCSAGFAAGGARQHLRQAVAVENVIAQHRRYPTLAEFDLSKPEALAERLDALKPDFIINPAA